jgi:PAS domain S-box-containing protein
MTRLFRDLGPDACDDLVDLAAEAVVVCDLAGVVRYWNPASERLYGWPAMAMVGLDLSDIATELPLHVEAWTLLLREGVWEGEVSRRSVTGGSVVVNVRRTLRRHADGAPRDVVEYGWEVRTSAPEPGPERRAELRRATAACWELDMSGAHTAGVGGETLAPLHQWRIIDANARTVRLFGGHADRVEMIGRPLSDFWPAESREDIVELLHATRSRAPGAPLERTLSVHGLLSGTTATAWRSIESGRQDVVFLMVSGAASDDRTAWELQASEDRYRKLIHFTPTPLLYVDARRSGDALEQVRAEGVTDIGSYLAAHPELVELAKGIVVVTEVNQAAVSLFGARNAAELVQSVRYLFSATPGMAERVMTAHFEGRRIYVEQAKMATFDGRIRDVVFSVTYPTPPEFMDTTFITIEDITERLRTEAELRRLQANFAHAARVSTLGELTTSIAHEVNQPLSAIRTNADASLRWLAQDPPNLSKVKLLTERIAAGAGRASEIIQRIRATASKREPQQAPLELRAVIEEALLFVHHDLDAKGIVLTLDLDRELPPVSGDRVQLQQVIVNLLVNSIQAIEHGGGARREIRLVATTASNSVTIQIRDSGPGIAAEHLANVFDGFFTTKESGIGIGLAICQSIIADHGGDIRAANHDEGGAVFHIVLPLDRHDSA